MDGTTNIKCLNARRSSGRWLPVRGQERAQVVLVGERREAAEDVAHVGEWLLAVAEAGKDDRVEHGHALAGLWVADEQPVLLAEAGGAYGVLDAVGVEFGAAMLEVGTEGTLTLRLGFDRLIFTMRQFLKVVRLLAFAGLGFVHFPNLSSGATWLTGSADAASGLTFSAVRDNTAAKQLVVADIRASADLDAPLTKAVLTIPAGVGSSSVIQLPATELPSAGLSLAISHAWPTGGVISPRVLELPPRTDLGDGWKWSSSLGRYYQYPAQPMKYSMVLGPLYERTVSNFQGYRLLYLYSAPPHTWVATRDDVFPYVWSYATHQWIYFARASGSRWWFDPIRRDWVRF